MRSARPHILDDRETQLQHNPYAPKITLDRHLAEEVSKISSYASLGFHPAAFVRLSNGEVVAFTEWYPLVAVPCNGRNASSLFEVGTLGGPALPAHELCLEIQGSVTMEQVRAIRRIRGVIPELRKVELNDSQVVLYHAELDNPLHFNDRQAVLGACAKSFGKDREVVFVEDDRPIHETITLSPLDRLGLRKMASMAWTEDKKHRGGGPKRLPHEDPRYKHVQTVLFDIPDSVSTLIEQGPFAKDNKSLWRIDDRWPVGVTSCRLDGQVWHDSARSAVMRCGVIPESIRVSARGHELFITALLPERATSALGKTRGPNEYPFSTRFWGINNEDRLTRDFFELLPPTWNFRGIKESPCKKLVWLDADAPGQPSLAQAEQQVIEQRTRRTVYYSHNRFDTVSINDSHIRAILDHVPFNSVLLSAKRCPITDDVQLTTVHEIPERMLHTIREDLGYSVVNKVAGCNAPVAIQTPVTLISQGRQTPTNLQPISDENIRTLKVIGGAKNIGGSSLLLGNILLDCGAYPRNVENVEDFSQFQLSHLEGAQAAFITHGHLDHVGNALHLTHRNIPVFMHHATALISWPLLLEQTGSKTGFMPPDVEELYQNILPVPFRYRLDLSDTLSATLHEAGHMAGSSMVVIEHKGQEGVWRAMYTGDLQRDEASGHQRIYPSAAVVPNVDALIIEATNGMASVEPRAQLEAQLLECIHESLALGGRVLLPALASRVPELLTLLAQHRKAFSVPIYVDGPALSASNDIHGYLSHLQPELFIHSDRSDQGWRGVQSGYFREFKRLSESQFLADTSPRIVVTSGGMGQGTSARHIKGARTNDTVIFTCYQAMGSSGRALLEKYQAAIETDTLREWDGPRVLSQRLSGHIAGEQLLAFVKGTLKPGGTVILVHGGDDEKIAVKAALTAQNHAGEIIIARAGETIDL